MSGKFYITTPIYYVNDKPHIGHAYTTVLADVLARFHRLLGDDTWFLTGTDEHGLKVQRAAEASKMSPQEQADKTVVRFKELWDRLGITNDDFVRTTERRHTEIVQEILQELFEKGEIYKSEYDGWYCPSDERFFTEKDLVEGNCPECGRAVEAMKEANYFFRTSRYQEWLITYINDHPGFIQPDFRRNETLGFLKKPLQDLCISRPKERLAWGIELPFDRNFVTWVWFDALVNYISAIGYRRDQNQYQRWWPASYHLIGKDILTTHSVYWPIMLKAIGLQMPDAIFAHGWWLSGQAKMSKSLGNVVSPMDMIDRFGVDAFRYFLMAEMPLGQDASFTPEQFETRYNADLANDLGNLLSRVAKMIEAHLGGVLPQAGEAGPLERELEKKVIDASGSMTQAVERMKIDQGIGAVLGAVRATNRYLEKSAPWTLAKSGDRKRLESVMYASAEALRIVSGWLHPVMPKKMEELRSALGLGKDGPGISELSTWGALPSGARIGKAPILFPKFEQQTTAGTSKTNTMITIDDFKNVQLRIATITNAERVEKSDKLVKIQISLGAEQRQIVAGIAQHYKPQDLVGRTIVVVANLKPAKLMGQESQGMLLAAHDEQGNLALLTVDREISPGSPVR